MPRAGVDWTAHAAGAGALPVHCHAAAPRLSGLPRAGSVRPGRSPAREACAWRRPKGRADRPGPRSTADDGTLTRERHRLACGSPSRAPGRRPGGVTLGFSDRCPVSGARRRRRHPVPYSPWWSTRSPVWRAAAWTGQLTRRWPAHFPPTATPLRPGVRSPRGGSVRPGRWPAREACAWRRPTGRADRPGPRSTADDGTLTRERHRLACGSPSRAPGRRPGGVTLGFSDRCPVPDGDGDIRFRTARGGRRDLQHGARRRGLDSSRGGGRRTSRPLPRCRAPVVRSPRGGSVRPGRWPAREACAWRRPTGRADRPGPRSTADDGTLTRERHRLACGSPSRAPGRRPGGVTLGFSDRCPVPRWRRRPPVPCSPVVVDEISSMARAGVNWTAHAVVGRHIPADPGWRRSTIFLRTVGNIPK